MASVQLMEWLVCFSSSASQSTTAQVVRCTLEVERSGRLMRFDPKTIFLISVNTVIKSLKLFILYQTLHFIPVLLWRTEPGVYTQPFFVAPQPIRRMLWEITVE
jgi:hypothetical protein